MNTLLLALLLVGTASCSTLTCKNEDKERAKELVNDPQFLTFVYIDETITGYTFDDFEIVCEHEPDKLVSCENIERLPLLYYKRALEIVNNSNSDGARSQVYYGHEAPVQLKAMSRIVDMLISKIATRRNQDDSHETRILYYFCRLPPGNLRDGMIKFGLESKIFTVDSVLRAIPHGHMHYRDQMMRDMDYILGELELIGDKYVRGLFDDCSVLIGSLASRWVVAQHSPLHYLTPKRQRDLLHDGITRQQLLDFLPWTFTSPKFCSPQEALYLLARELEELKTNPEERQTVMTTVLTHNPNILIDNEDQKLFDDLMNADLARVALSMLFAWMPMARDSDRLFTPNAQKVISKLLGFIKNDNEKAFYKLALIDCLQEPVVYSTGTFTVEGLASNDQATIDPSLPSDLSLLIDEDVYNSLAQKFRTSNVSTSPRNPIKFFSSMRNTKALVNLYAGVHINMHKQRIDNVKRFIESVDRFMDPKESFASSLLASMQHDWHEQMANPRTMIEEKEPKKREEYIMHSLVFRTGPFAVENNIHGVREDQEDYLSMLNDFCMLMYPLRMAQIKAAKQVLSEQADIQALFMHPWINKHWVLNFYGNLYTPEPPGKSIHRLFTSDATMEALLQYKSGLSEVFAEQKGSRWEGEMKRFINIANAYYDSVEDKSTVNFELFTVHPSGSPQTEMDKIDLTAKYVDGLLEDLDCSNFHKLLQSNACVASFALQRATKLQDPQRLSKIIYATVFSARNSAMQNFLRHVDHDVLLNIYISNDDLLQLFVSNHDIQCDLLFEMAKKLCESNEWDDSYKESVILTHYAKRLYYQTGNKHATLNQVRSLSPNNPKYEPPKSVFKISKHLDELLAKHKVTLCKEQLNAQEYIIVRFRGDWKLVPKSASPLHLYSLVRNCFIQGYSFSLHNCYGDGGLISMSIEESIDHLDGKEVRIETRQPS